MTQPAPLSPLAVYREGMRASVRPILRLRPERLWEIDALRGVAILMMVIYHLLWDLQGLGGYKINVYTGFWHYFQLATASLFTGLAGVSLAVRYQMQQQRGQARPGTSWQRGAVIFTWGLVVGIVTYLFDPKMYVRWGILHLIGFAMVAAWPLRRYRWLNLALGLGVILIGKAVTMAGLNLGSLDWLGLDASPSPAFDYFPILPWLGLPLLGIFAGHTLFRGSIRRLALPDLSRFALVRWLRLLGQNSLLIYLLHQPLLLTILTLLGVVHL